MCQMSKQQLIIKKSFDQIGVGDTVLSASLHVYSIYWL